MIRFPVTFQFNIRLGTFYLFILSDSTELEKVRGQGRGGGKFALFNIAFKLIISII